MRFQRKFGIAVAALVLLSFMGMGCDNLPRPFKKSGEQAAAPTTAAHTAPDPVTPNKPILLPADILATVNGASVSRYDAQLRIQEIKALMTSLGRTWTPLTPEQLESLVDELVNNELISQDAMSRGLDRQTETQRRWEYTRRAFFVQEWLRWHQEHQEQLGVPTQDVEQYYEQNKLFFRLPERRKLRQLVFATEDQAKTAYVKLLEGVDLASIVPLSLRPDAAQGSMAQQWTMRAAAKAVFAPNDDSVRALADEKLEQAAFAIDKIGGFSGIVQGADNNFHLFQLVEREAERQQALNEVWDRIKGALTLQKYQKVMEELKTKAAIQRFLERVEGIQQ